MIDDLAALVVVHVLAEVVDVTSVLVRRHEVSRHFDERSVLRLALLEHPGDDAVDHTCLVQDRNRERVVPVFELEHSTGLHRYVRVHARWKQVRLVDIETIAPFGV